MTHERAIHVLATHGFTPTTSSVWADERQDGTSFYAEVGKRAHYALMDVLGWLGYCCPTC
tara:strand:+ start:588 stop:767 length:180 start_codon:yes stop_codon:yes gene_type:complete